MIYLGSSHKLVMWRPMMEKLILSYKEKESYITRDPSPLVWRTHPNYDIMKTAKDIIQNRVCADLGCNHGACTILLHDFNPLHVDGYDINEKALYVAERTAELHNVQHKTNFIPTNLKSIPVEDAQYDTITTFHTLEHIYPWDTDDVIKEMWRILKPNGHVLISIPYKHHYPDKCHVAFYDEITLKNVFEKQLFTTMYCFEDNRWSEQGLLTGLFRK